MKKLVALFILCFFQFSFSQITNTKIVAELKVETTDNVSTLISKTSNKTDVYYSLKYVFSVITYDPNNKTSKESIEDLFTLDPYESKDLHKTSINIEDDKIIVLLLIYDEDDKLVAKSRVVFNEREEQKEPQVLNRPKDGIEISGIVVDETKTKMGRDFYDRFYFYYTYNELKGNEVIKVDEQRTFRRSTKIIVSIGDEVLAEFFARPNEEYIEEISKFAMQKVYKYFQNKEREKSYITQY